MKKILSNWRYYVMYSLFFVGFFALLIVAGDAAEDMSFAREMFIRLCAAGVSAIAFCTHSKCVKYWESRNEIPEYTNSDNENDDVWE